MSSEADIARRPGPRPVRGTDGQILELLFGLGRFPGQHCAADDVWMVGCCTNKSAATYQWNGIRWKSFATRPTGRPARRERCVELDCGRPVDRHHPLGRRALVDERSAERGAGRRLGGQPDDAWAVGGTATGETVALHWDGSSWHEITSPDPNFYTSAVTALSPTDVWIGEEAIRRLIEHWDGSHLTVVPCPPTDQYSELVDLSAVSSTDIWAVGERDDTEHQHALTMHWEGVSWSQVKGPAAGHHKTWLEGVAAVAGDDAWTVGYHLIGDRSEYQVAGHWDGFRPETRPRSSTRRARWFADLQSGAMRLPCSSQCSATSCWVGLPPARPASSGCVSPKRCALTLVRRGWDVRCGPSYRVSRPPDRSRMTTTQSTRPSLSDVLARVVAETRAATREHPGAHWTENGVHFWRCLHCPQPHVMSDDDSIDPSTSCLVQHHNGESWSISAKT